MADGGCRPGTEKRAVKRDVGLHTDPIIARVRSYHYRDPIVWANERRKSLVTELEPGKLRVRVHGILANTRSIDSSSSAVMLRWNDEHPARRNKESVQSPIVSGSRYRGMTCRAISWALPGRSCSTSLLIRPSNSTLTTLPYSPSVSGKLTTAARPDSTDARLNVRAV